MSTTDQHGFTTRNCARCNGTGNYSRNADGITTCYGCNGTGRAYTSKAGKARAAWIAANTKAGAIPARNLGTGDKVLLDGRPVNLLDTYPDTLNPGRLILDAGATTWSVGADDEIPTPGIHTSPAPYAEAAR